MSLPRTWSTALNIAVILGSLAGWIAFPGTPAQAAPPSMSRPEIIARAESALGTAYTWGGESWVPNSNSAGPDCSGLVLKSWQAPRTMLYEEEDPTNCTISPRYTTYELYNGLGPWYTLGSRSYLLAGDAVVKNNGTSGHVVLYAEGDGWGYPVVYEAPYTGATVRRTTKYLGSEYRPIRRYSISGTDILLDNPSAKTTEGTDIGGNWPRSTSNTGYYGDNYQVRAATSARSYARWTPRLPASGYYDVYLRWTSGWNRATNAKITINTPSGQKVKYVNQQTNGGMWVLIGRYQLNGGYSTGSGSIAIHATGANGYVVADAALFQQVY
jgi:hypothetical protein